MYVGRFGRGQRGVWKLSVLSTQFFSKPKTNFKKWTFALSYLVNYEKQFQISLLIFVGLLYKNNKSTDSKNKQKCYID